MRRAALHRSVIHRSGAFVVICFLLVSVFALLGTGFSVWVFSETEVSAELNVHVTAVESDGTWTAELPVVVVLDEGVNGGINTVKGFSFYKCERDSAGNLTTEVSLDTVLPLEFTLNAAALARLEQVTTEDGTVYKEPEDLTFGFRMMVKGPLDGSVHRTSAYLDMARLSEDENYIDLKQLYYGYTWDGTEGKFTFTLTTVMFNSFFDYNTGKRPSADNEYQTLKSLKEQAEDSQIMIELWQGGSLPAASVSP